jgi:hypothetical protein
VLAAIGLVAFGFYFYERTQFLRMAEEKARAVGERVYETGGKEERAEGGDLKPE